MKLLIVGLLACCGLNAQARIPGPGGASPPAFFTDAITPGSDSNACTLAAPCATLTHTLTVSGASQVYLKYPDGNYYTAPPITTGLAAFYPVMKGSSATTLYDVANGNHGTLTNASGANCVWYSTGCMFIASQHPYITLPNLTSVGPATLAAMYTPGFDPTVNTNLYILYANSDNVQFFEQNGVNQFGMNTGVNSVVAASSNAAQFAVAVVNGASSALYRDGSSLATGTLVNRAITGTVTIGRWPGGGNYFSGWMSSLLVYSTALSSGDVGTLNTWQNTVEYPRTHAAHGMWTRLGTQIPVATLTTEEPSLVHDNTAWHLWVTDNDGGTGVHHFTSPTSPQSPTWTDQGATTGFGIRSSVKPNPNGGFWGTSAGGFYTSSNGTAWTNQATIVAVGTAGAWDDGHIYNGALLVDAATGCKFIYEADSNHGTYGVGTATASYTGSSPNPCGSWTKDNTSATPTFVNFAQPDIAKSGSTYIMWGQFADNVGFFRFKATTWGTWTQDPIGGSSTDPAGATFVKGSWNECVGYLSSGGDCYIADPAYWDDGAFGGGQYLVYTAQRYVGGVSQSVTKAAYCNCTLAQLVASTEQMTGTNP